MAVADHDRLNRSQIPSQGQGVLNDAESLPGVEKIIAFGRFHETGEAVFAHHPERQPHGIFT
jgi:hypothetical protein